MTQWTCAFSLASLSQRNVRHAKSMTRPYFSKSGRQSGATCSPCVIEFVETNAARAAVPAIRAAARWYHAPT